MVGADGSVEARISARGIHAGHCGNLILRHRIAVSVHYLGSGSAENYSGIAVKNGDALLQELGCAEVIVRPPFEVLSAGEFENSIVSPRRAPIDVTPVVPDAAVALCVRPADLLGAVHRCIVGDYYFQVFEGLA
jgi:hypothetical protein